MKRPSAAKEKVRAEKRRQKVARDAESGQFVTYEYEEANPVTTVMETVEIPETLEVSGDSESGGETDTDD